MRTATGFQAVAAVLLAGVLVAPGPAAAQCFYDDIAAGSTYSFSDQGTPRFNQVAGYWMAIAVRPPATDDWDIGVYSTTAAYPTCVSGLLANSTAAGNGVDFVVGDFNSGGNATGTYLAKVNRYSGSGPTAYVQWDSGVDALVVNDNPISRSTNAITLVECWDVFLYGGRTYTFTLSHGGTAALKVLLFRNPAAAPYWAGRSSRVMEAVSTGTYVAPASGWYGVVVVNDNGGDDSYQLAVGTCEAPTALVSGAPSPATGISAWRSFAQASSYFTAVAVRSDDPAQDWDLELYSAASGGAYPACFGSYVAGSALGSARTDFVVGDFNSGANPPGTYYARAHPYGATTSSARIEWDDGPDQIAVDGPPITRSTGSNDLIECWDVYLNGGQNFGINFTHDGTADLKVMVFHNPGAGYWVPRSSADLVSSGNTYYSAPSSDWYSIVVVNDNGGSGTYKLGVAQCAGMFTIPSGNVYFSTANGWLEIHPTETAWAVFGVLNSPDELAGNWDARIYRDGTGGVFPSCPSTLLGASVLPTGKVDFVAGDFHVNAPGYFYPVAYPNAGASSNVKFGWDGGAEVITVNAPPVDRTQFQYGLLESWDVYLEAGQTYDFQFHVNSGNLRLVLMRNPGQSPYWAGRAAGEFDVAGGDHPYVAPTTGWYGVVVVNDGINSWGDFTLGINSSLVAVDPLVGLVDRLVSSVPNPTRSGVTFDYELREPAAVSFEVMDVAGRLVAQIPVGVQGSGRGARAWDGAASDGHRVSAGVYFVRMKVAGRTTGKATIVMLR